MPPLQRVSIFAVIHYDQLNICANFLHECEYFLYKYIALIFTLILRYVRSVFKQMSSFMKQAKSSHLAYSWLQIHFRLKIVQFFLFLFQLFRFRLRGKKGLATVGPIKLRTTVKFKLLFLIVLLTLEQRTKTHFS